MRKPALDEVYLWHIPVIASRETLIRARHTLSCDERRRADSFTLEPARIRYTICRADVRGVLANLNGCEPHEVEFSYGKNGKPFLRGMSTSLTFNVAHSDNLAILAVSGGTEIGIDLERIRPIHELESIMSEMFSNAEQESLKYLPEVMKTFRFLQIWTHKEALLKALGCGLEISPIDVDSLNGSITTPGRDSFQKAQCSLYDLHTPPGFVAALATKLPVETKVHLYFQQSCTQGIALR